MSTLWFRSPAKVWEEALPLGTGRLGAMCFGGLGADVVQLNDDRLWTGPPDTAKYLPLADVHIDVGADGPVEDYRRELDLATGVRRVTYRAGDVEVGQEAVCHAGLHVLAARVTGGAIGQVRLRIALDSRQVGHRGHTTEPVRDPSECIRLAVKRLKRARTRGWARSAPRPSPLTTSCSTTAATC